MSPHVLWFVGRFTFTGNALIFCVRLTIYRWVASCKFTLGRGGEEWVTKPKHSWLVPHHPMCDRLHGVLNT